MTLHGCNFATSPESPSEINQEQFNDDGVEGGQLSRRGSSIGTYHGGGNLSRQGGNITRRKGFLRESVVPNSKSSPQFVRSFRPISRLGNFIARYVFTHICRVK